MPFKATLKDLKLEEGSIDWTDNAVSPAVQTRLSASATLTDAVIGPTNAPAKLHLAAKVDGSIDNAVIDGVLVLNPEAPSAQLQIAVDGLRAGQLAAYMPANVASTFQDGHFAATLDIGAANHPAGGIAAHLVASQLVLEDRKDKTTWASLDSFKLLATR